MPCEPITNWLRKVTLKPVKVARKMRDRRFQRALLQFFKPENWFEVREALREAGRTDLIGDHREALIPANPPREAVVARRRKAEEALEKKDKRSAGYRPHRRGWKKTRRNRS